MKKLILTAALILSACKSEPPPSADLPSDAAIAAMSMSSGGAPNEEVALDFYKTLTLWAKDYPALRPAILDALNSDGVVTYMEYDRISTEQQVFATAEGKKDWDTEAKPYRQALKQAASS